MNKIDSIKRRADRILFKLKRTDITIYIHSIMASLGWLKFRDIGSFYVPMQVSIASTYASFVFFALLIRLYMGVPEYLSKGVIIRATTRPSRKCELMKLYVPFVSSMYADADFTVAAPKYWNSLPGELRTLSSFITFKCRLYSYMLSL